MISKNDAISSSFDGKYNAIRFNLVATGTTNSEEFISEENVWTRSFADEGINIVLNGDLSLIGTVS